MHSDSMHYLGALIYRRWENEKPNMVGGRPTAHSDDSQKPLAQHPTEPRATTRIVCILRESRCGSFTSISLSCDLVFYVMRMPPSWFPCNMAVGLPPTNRNLHFSDPIVATNKNHIWLSVLSVLHIRCSSYGGRPTAQIMPSTLPPAVS